jgi:hypothetical protein
MEKQERKLNNLINTMGESELKEILMFVSTISQDGDLKKLKKYLKLKPNYNQYINQTKRL